MRFYELLAGIAPIGENADFEITGLTLDSRQVKPGFAFFAVAGSCVDGRNFIADAIANGAAAILTEARKFKCELPLAIPIVQIENLPTKVGLIAAKFYGNPTKDMRIIGITGTNGKTSCSHFVANALTANGVKCAVSGTIGTGFCGELRGNINTTPDAITLQYDFAELKKQHAQAVAMEVSSHAIDMQRIVGTCIDVGVFTNLTQDHLDYHGTMKNYAECKEQLFLHYNVKYAVINADDLFGQNIIRKVRNKLAVISYGCISAADVKAVNIKLSLAGIEADVVSPWGTGKLTSKLLGRFNLSNLLASLSVLGVMGVPFNAALNALSKTGNVFGRMQILGGKNGPLIIVDYAHTPDALKNVLQTLKELRPNKLICLFGCGGDRDRGKRSLMAQVAESLSDEVILTNDNPRTEDAEKIIGDVLVGFQNKEKILIETDRAKAITLAVKCAKKGDIVVIAGKGHEDYQIIGRDKIYFSDVECVKGLLQ